MASTKRALVTGASGFIGTSLTRRLLDEGWDVHVVLRPSSDLGQLNDFKSRIHIHIHDGSTEQMVQIMSGVRPQIVFHLASLFLAQHRTKDLEVMLQANVIFATQLLEAMATTGCNYLVNTGTSWQHFNNSTYDPVCLYAATKQAFEDIMHFYVNATSIQAITIKLFDTYGPSDHRRKLLGLLLEAAQAGEQLELSPGEQLLDLVYIDDVVEGFLVAAARLLCGEVEGQEVYSLSSGSQMSLKELVLLLTRLIEKPINVIWGGRPYRPREVMIPWNQGSHLPGWAPKVGIEEGLRITIRPATTKGC